MSTFDLPDRVGRVILASGSPRRIELLREAGFDPIVAPQDVDETAMAGELPGALVERLARLKATAAMKSCELKPGDVIIAADTIVSLNDELLGKPVDEADARRMLSELSGNKHQVKTGVCIIFLGREPQLESFVETSDVEFYDLTVDEIAAYVATGEPMDKAGSYGIQGKGRTLVKRIDGCYFNIVGLPVARLLRKLEQMLGEQTDSEVEAKEVRDPHELSDESISEVGGGIYSIPDPKIYNSKNQEIGRPNLGKIYYCPCPTCGKPTHKDWVFWWWCDPCGKSYYNISEKEWTGSEQALKDASL